MQLTKYEKEMLEGAHGEAKKFAMEVLIRLGKIYGADRMVKIVSAHIMAHYGSLHDAGIELVEKFVNMGGESFVFLLRKTPLQYRLDIGKK